MGLHFMSQKTRTLIEDRSVDSQGRGTRFNVVADGERLERTCDAVWLIDGQAAKVGASSQRSGEREPTITAREWRRCSEAAAQSAGNSLLWRAGRSRSLASTLAATATQGWLRTWGAPPLAPPRALAPALLQLRRRRPRMCFRREWRVPRSWWVFTLPPRLPSAFLNFVCRPQPHTFPLHNRNGYERY